jgi:hypothetical protein
MLGKRLRGCRQDSGRATSELGRLHPGVQEDALSQCLRACDVFVRRHMSRQVTQCLVVAESSSTFRLTQFGRAEANFTFLTRSGDGFLQKNPLSNRLLSLCHSTYHLDSSQAARSELGAPKQTRLLIHPRPIDPLCPPDFVSSPQSCPSFSVAAQVSTTPAPARSLIPHVNTDSLQDRTRERSTR